MSRQADILNILERFKSIPQPERNPEGTQANCLECGSLFYRLNENQIYCDPNKYEFMKGVSFSLDTISVNQDSFMTVLHLSMLKYGLFNAILQFLNGETKIRKCLAEDCQRAFIPITLKQVYHSDTCRARVGKRRERNKQEYVNVN